MFIQDKNISKGFALIEVVLSVSLLSIYITAFVVFLLYQEEISTLAGDDARAALVASEAVNVVNNISEENFNSLTEGNYGLSISNNSWQLVPAPEQIDIFQRQISISDVDANRKDLTVDITWNQNASKAKNLTVHSRITNWQPE